MKKILILITFLFTSSFVYANCYISPSPSWHTWWYDLCYGLWDDVECVSSNIDIGKLTIDSSYAYYKNKLYYEWELVWRWEYEYLEAWYAKLDDKVYYNWEKTEIDLKELEMKDWRIVDWEDIYRYWPVWQWVGMYKTVFMEWYNSYKFIDDQFIIVDGKLYHRNWDAFPLDGNLLEKNTTKNWSWNNAEEELSYRDWFFEIVIKWSQSYDPCGLSAYKMSYESPKMYMTSDIANKMNQVIEKYGLQSLPTDKRKWYIEAIEKRLEFLDFDAYKDFTQSLNNREMKIQFILIHLKNYLESL